MNTAVAPTPVASLGQAAAPHHAVVSAEDWLARRKALMAREKELVRLGDEIARERRALPWERVAKDYVFDTPDGPRSLAELFAGRRQLVVQHFMFGPGWEQGCPSCSFMADHTDGMTIHLAQRDVSFVAISRATLPEIRRFKARMGWKFDWVSSSGNDFNRDFHVSFDPQDRVTGSAFVDPEAADLDKSQVYYNYGLMPFPNTEAPGISVFWKDDGGEVFHTYSTFGRGVEVMMGAYRMLDLVPKGRDERDTYYKMEWVRHHDRYAPQAAAGSCCASAAKA